MSDLSSAAVSRLNTSARTFLETEDGGATIWSLTWLMGLGIMAGLSIDATNARRHQTMLQSTADVAALAAAWELPENYLEEPYAHGSYTVLEDAGIDFAGYNLSPADYGAYFIRSDIFVGNWDKDTRTFTPGFAFATGDELPVNAVRVQMEESSARDNGVQTTLLHLVGLGNWDMSVTATALKGVLKCYQNGIIAREGIDLASNAKILKNICIHGQLVANANNNVYWKNPDSLTTGLSPQGAWEVSPGQYDADGNSVDMSVPIHQNLYPPMVDMIPAIARGMLRGDEHFEHLLFPDPNGATPAVIQLPDSFREITETTAPAGDPPTVVSGGSDVVASMGTRTYTFLEVEQQGSQWQWPVDDPSLDPSTHGFTTTTEGAPAGTTASLDEYRIYFADDCHGGNEGTVTLSGVVRNITLITTCAIDIDSDARIENAVLVSTAGSGGHNDKSVQIANGAQIGANTACDGWGGVRIYGNGMITSPSSGNNDPSFRQWYAAHLVARTSVQFAGLSDSSKGLSMFAGGEVKIAGNAEIGALDGALDETYPAGGCPADGVRQEYTWDAFLPILVD